MKTYEEILKGLECCSEPEAARCVECPYHEESDCRKKDKDAIKLILELKAQLEQPVIAGEKCTAMPNYEEMYNRLEKEVCVITHERNLAYAERDQAQQELYYLRAVKATAEAFLGRKIEG